MGSHLGSQYPKKRKGQKRKKQKTLERADHKPAFNSTGLQNPNAVHLYQVPSKSNFYSYWLCYDLSSTDETSRGVCNVHQIVHNTGIKVI